MEENETYWASTYYNPCISSPSSPTSQHLHTTYEKQKRNPTSFRRHVASPSRLPPRFLAALWFALAERCVRTIRRPKATEYLLLHLADTIFPGHKKPLLLAQIWMVHQTPVSASRAYCVYIMYRWIIKCCFTIFRIHNIDQNCENWMPDCEVKMLYEFFLYKRFLSIYI